MTAALTFFIAALLCLHHVFEYCHAPARAPVAPHRPADRSTAAAPADLAGGVACLLALRPGQYPGPDGPLLPAFGPGAGGLLDHRPGPLRVPDCPAAPPGGHAGPPPPSLRSRTLFLGP